MRGSGPSEAFMVLIALLPLIILLAWLLFISVERYTLTSSSDAGRPWWEQMAAWMRTAIRRPVLALAAATTARR
jgi:hypothetical protein